MRGGCSSASCINARRPRVRRRTARTNACIACSRRKRRNRPRQTRLCSNASSTPSCRPTTKCARTRRLTTKHPPRVGIPRHVRCQRASPPPTYPGHFELRRVSSAGTFRLHNGQQFLTQALNGEMIGLEEVHESVWNVLYYDTLLGRFDERTRTITGAPSLKKDC